MIREMLTLCLNLNLNPHSTGNGSAMINMSKPRLVPARAAQSVFFFPRKYLREMEEDTIIRSNRINTFPRDRHIPLPCDRLASKQQQASKSHLIAHAGKNNHDDRNLVGTNKPPDTEVRRE